MSRGRKSNSSRALSRKALHFTKNASKSFPYTTSDSYTSCLSSLSSTASCSNSSSSIDQTGISKPSSDIGERILEFIQCFKPEHRLRGKALEHPFETIPIDPTELRREFIESMAWVCASERRKNINLNVTAAALESNNDGKAVLWLAANQDISPETKSYAEEIIEMIKSFAGITAARKNHVPKFKTLHAFGIPGKSYLTSELSLAPHLQPLIQKIIHFKKNYIARRCEELHRCTDQLTEELRRLRKRDRSANIEECLKWLKCFKEEISSPSHIYLVTFLYSCRVDKMYDQLCRLSTDLSGFKGFSTRLYELGQPIFKALVLQKAAVALDFLQREVKVCSFGGNTCVGKVAKGIQHTPVHAEIYLVELFCKSERRLLEDDDFIGCSKPACFCCHMYIENVVNPLRKRNFFIRQAHDKIYPWLFPEARFMKAHPRLTPSDDWYLAKGFEIMMQTLTVERRKAENGQSGNFYPDISVGLPSFLFDKYRKSKGRKRNVQDKKHVTTVYWRPKVIAVG